MLNINFVSFSLRLFLPSFVLSFFLPAGFPHAAFPSTLYVPHRERKKLEPVHFISDFYDFISKFNDLKLYSLTLALEQSKCTKVAKFCSPSPVYFIQNFINTQKDLSSAVTSFYIFKSF